MLYDTTEKKVRGLITHFPVSKISEQLEETKKRADEDRINFDTELIRIGKEAAKAQEEFGEERKKLTRQYDDVTGEKAKVESTKKELEKAFHAEMAALQASFERKVETLKRVHESEMKQLIDNWPGDEKPILL